MEAQGYSIGSNILFRDTQSTILLENIGKSPADKKSKHKKNHYFLITNKVHQDDLEISYKPTGDILDDNQ